MAFLRFRGLPRDLAVERRFPDTRQAYVDENSPTITRNAPPTCGQCLRLTATRCPIEGCTHVIQKRTDAASANAHPWAVCLN